MNEVRNVIEEPVVGDFVVVYDYAGTPVLIRRIRLLTKFHFLVEGLGRKYRIGTGHEAGGGNWARGHCGPVTPEARAIIERQHFAMLLRKTDWRTVPLETLRTIYETVQGWPRTKR